MTRQVVDAPALEVRRTAVGKRLLVLGAVHHVRRSSSLTVSQHSLPRRQSPAARPFAPDQSWTRRPNQPPIGAPGLEKRSTRPPSKTFSPRVAKLSYSASKRLSARAKSVKRPRV